LHAKTTAALHCEPAGQVNLWKLAEGLREQGHEVRLMPAQYVKPYVKTNKSDFIDAEAIA
jgi:transposase